MLNHVTFRDFTKDYPSKRGLWRPPGLLQVCRKARSKAAPLYYSQNIFVVRSTSPGTFDGWSNAIGSGARSAIRVTRLDLCQDGGCRTESGAEK